MVRTQDGFELAELDLTLRGPGEFFGTRQAGLPDFRVANLVRDRQLLELAKHGGRALCQLGRRAPAKRPKLSARASGRGSKRPGTPLWTGGGGLTFAASVAAEVAGFRPARKRAGALQPSPAGKV